MVPNFMEIPWELRRLCAAGFNIRTNNSSLMAQDHPLFSQSSKQLLRTRVDLLELTFLGCFPPILH